MLTSPYELFCATNAIMMLVNVFLFGMIFIYINDVSNRIDAVTKQFTFINRKMKITYRMLHGLLDDLDELTELSIMNHAMNEEVIAYIYADKSSDTTTSNYSNDVSDEDDNNSDEDDNKTDINTEDKKTTA
jgi:hypothetical protein